MNPVFTKEIYLDLLWYDAKNIRGIGKMSLSYTLGICKQLPQNQKIEIFVKNEESKNKIINYGNLLENENVRFKIIKNRFLFYAFTAFFFTKKNNLANLKSYYIAFGSIVPFYHRKNVVVINFFHDFVWYKNLFDLKKIATFKREIAYSLLLFATHYIKSKPIVDYFISKQVQDAYPNIFKKSKAFQQEILLNPVEINEQYRNLQKDENSIVYIGPKREVKNFKAVKYLIEKFEFNKFAVSFKLINISKKDLGIDFVLKNVNITEYGLLHDDKVQEIIASSKIIFIPSLSESFSYPAFYAYSYKTLIVGTKHSPFQEYLSDSFFSIDPLNFNDCFNAVIKGLKYSIKSAPVLNNTIQNQTSKLLSKIYSKPPIIIFHNGNQKYFEYILKNLVGKHFDVIVVGNIPPKNPNILFINTESILPGFLTDFNESYVHMSKNGYYNEFNCFLRWFYILELVKKLNIKSFWHLDSDVLVSDSFYNYSNEIEELGNTSIFTPTQRDEMQLSSSAHVSYWISSDLDDFIKFIIYKYKTSAKELTDKWNYHLTNKINGGVCDMTLLYLWQKSTHNIKNIAFLSLSYLYNDNLNEVKGGKLALKKIKFEDDIFLDVQSNKIIPFLHCQGQAKYFIYFKIFFGNSTAYKLTKLIYKLKSILIHLREKNSF